MSETFLSSIPWQHIHPILVNFTAALVPVSVASDIFGKITKSEPLRSTAWWTLLYAALITPLTAAAGWFWKSTLPAAALPDQIISVHQWIGTIIAVLFVVLSVWRGRIHLSGRETGYTYLFMALLVVALLMYQGSLGGEMVFG